MKLEVKNLKKKFKDFNAVKNINFSINAGQTLGVLGPNGCGKTTTIGMLLGLIKPSSGEILIDDENFEKLNREKILSSFNFASPYVELPKKLTVKENLEIYGRLYGVKDLNQRIEEISHDLNLGLFLNKKTGELSSGQKNRVSLAKSLINKPKILFLDEPTLGLDINAQANLRKFLQIYNKQTGATILLTSHYMKDITYLCKRVICIHEGYITYDGKLEKLLTKLSPNKDVSIICKSNKDIENLKKLNLKIKNINDNQITFTVNKLEFKNTLKEILNKFDIEDLHINEPPIDEVIGKILINKK